MRISRYFSTIPDGNPVPNGVEVELRAASDNSLVATQETSGGWVEFVLDGNPVGPHFMRCLYNSEVQVVSSRATGVSATTDVANLPLFIRTFEDGYVRGVLGQLAVTGPGSAMSVSVASGAAYVRGVLYDQRAAKLLPIDAPDTQARIDLVVVEVVPPGGNVLTEGRSRLMVKRGVPAASPVAPSLTQTDALYEVALAEVAVAPGVAAITSSAITDRRKALSPFLPDGSVTVPRLADGPKSTTNGVYVLQTDAAGRPKWAYTTLHGLGDVFTPTPNDGDLLMWDARANEGKGIWVARNKADLGLGSGGGISGSLFEFNDYNFDGKGAAAYGSGTTLETGAITLGPGTWVIESEVNVSLRGVSSGWSSTTLSLAGSGAPQGAANSARVFDTVQGDPDQKTLSGRQEVIPTRSTTYTVTGKATGREGTVEVMSGVLRLKAYRRT